MLPALWPPCELRIIHALVGRAMDDKIRPKVAGWSLRAAADPGLVAEVVGRLGIDLPPDYRAFLEEANGGEGFVGDGGFLKPWPIDEIDSSNEGLQVSESAPGLVFFGTDGGGEGYAFDTRERPHRVVQVPLIGMADGDTWIDQGATLAELLDRVGEQA